MFSPLNGPDPIIPLKSMRSESGKAGSVRAKKSAKEENLASPIKSRKSGRKNTPLRNMLNELKKLKYSNVAPIVTT